MTEPVRIFFDRWMASVDIKAMVTDYFQAEHAYYRTKGYELHHEPGIGLVWEHSPFLYRFNTTNP